MKTRTVIIDDDRSSIQILENLLEEYDFFRIVGKAYNAANGRELILEERPDLLFLDMDLPDTHGTALLEEISNSIDWPMKVVFYTAYDQYMLQAIRDNAFDYLLKPFTKEDLDVIIQRYINLTENASFTPSFRTSHPTSCSQVFAVRTIRNDIRLLRLENIGYFHYNSQRKLWSVVLDNQTEIALKKGTTKETILGYHHKFTQIHPSVIINMDYLMMISDNKCKLFPPFENADDLIISRSHLKELMNQFQGI